MNELEELVKQLGEQHVRSMLQREMQMFQMRSNSSRACGGPAKKLLPQEEFLASLLGNVQL